MQHRKECLADIDAKLDHVAKKMVELKGTTADQETDIYLLLRDSKEAMNGYGTKRDEKIKSFIETIGNRLLARLIDQNVNSMRADPGTFYKEKVYRPSCADWKVLYKWIADHDQFEMLEKRLTKKNVVDYFDKTETLPPGINLNASYEIRVRKGEKA